MFILHVKTKKMDWEKEKFSSLTKVLQLFADDW